MVRSIRASTAAFSLDTIARRNPSCLRFTQASDTSDPRMIALRPSARAALSCTAGVIALQSRVAIGEDLNAPRIAHRRYMRRHLSARDSPMSGCRGMVRHRGAAQHHFVSVRFDHSRSERIGRTRMCDGPATSSRAYFVRGSVIRVARNTFIITCRRADTSSSAPAPS